jgi:SAM-dependent methyltransferase
VGDLAPGSSLDLGCGEGGDALWLAERGWRAIGIDLSATAIARARARAEKLGLSAEFVAADLGLWVEAGEGVDGSAAPFDLITASFLQSPVALPRERILRAALSRLAPGGRLVLVSHAAPPPWARHDQAAHGAHDPTRGPHFIAPEDELAALGGLESEFAVLVAELRQREVADPQGSLAQIDDSVVVVQRHQALPEVR